MLRHRYLYLLAVILCGLAFAPPPEFPSELGERGIWFGMVRSPEAPAPNEAYVANQLLARRRFATWLNGEDDGNFESMLREAHSFALTFPYAGTAGATLADPNRVQPGEWRSESMLMNWTGIPFPPEAFPDLAAAGIPSRPQGGKPLADVSSGSVSLSGIPPNALPRNERGNFAGVDQPGHQFPNVTHVRRFYLPAMEKLMREIKAIPVQRARQDPAVRKQLVSKLALYYQIGINAHIFRGINNSLLMGQVNETLHHFGMRPLAHGYMDYVAFAVPSDKFVDFFLSRWEQAQKHSPEYAPEKVAALLPRLSDLGRDRHCPALWKNVDRRVK